MPTQKCYTITKTVLKWTKVGKYTLLKNVTKVPKFLSSIVIEYKNLFQNFVFQMNERLYIKCEKQCIKYNNNKDSISIVFISNNFLNQIYGNLIENIFLIQDASK